MGAMQRDKGARIEREREAARERQGTRTDLLPGKLPEGDYALFGSAFARAIWWLGQEGVIALCVIILVCAVIRPVLGSMYPSKWVLRSGLYVEPIAELGVVSSTKDIIIINAPPNIDAVNIFTGVFNDISSYADWVAWHARFGTQEHHFWWPTVAIREILGQIAVMRRCPIETYSHAFGWGSAAVLPMRGVQEICRYFLLIPHNDHRDIIEKNESSFDQNKGLFSKISGRFGGFGTNLGSVSRHFSIAQTFTDQPQLPEEQSNLHDGGGEQTHGDDIKPPGVIG